MGNKNYEELLSIQTEEEQKGFNQSFHYHRYEPTPYHYLVELFDQYELTKEDRVVDFGCGKGRLNFLIHYLFQATVIGIEFNEAFYQEALKNRDRYCKKRKNGKDKIYFQHCKAEEYVIHPLDSHFYFFNPFSFPVFIKVINNILRSVAENNRKVDVILYYASNDYQYFLDNHSSFRRKATYFLAESEHDAHERFLIYETI
ncbi:methyltransferase domain-containing protein [Niallia sp. 01092]|uniref:methyltransferase domain-containing protein n=1 Tax=unclassified Niallia TaxID=2837522 RepID=UPI003FD5B171